MGRTLSWSFAELCDGASSVQTVANAFLKEVGELGFSHVACASHVDPLMPPPGAVMILNYPQTWLDHFSASKYARRDPVFLAAREQLLPFRWSDGRFRAGLADDQVRILAEAGEAGLKDGFSIPIHSPGALPASCSLVIGADGVDPLDFSAAQWLAVCAHEAVRRLSLHRDQTHVRLSRREKECLELVARGKDDWSIGMLMGVSERTAHNTVMRAMRRYGVATRIQAVVRAMRQGEIRIEDLAE
jgi:DNA-binding CsgD family transcriptional regulator